MTFEEAFEEAMRNTDTIKKRGLSAVTDSKTLSKQFAKLMALFFGKDLEIIKAFIPTLIAITQTLCAITWEAGYRYAEANAQQPPEVLPSEETEENDSEDSAPLV